MQEASTWQFQCSGSCTGSSTFQLLIQSGEKMWTMWVPSGDRLGSRRVGMETKRVPRGLSIFCQSSTMMWWHCVPGGSTSARTPV